MAMSTFYLVSQRALYADWKKQIKYLPLLMALGISLCVNNARAGIEGLLGHQSDFHRTPKYGVTTQQKPGRKYAGTRTLLSLAEMFMAGYFFYILVEAWSVGLYFGIPFMLLFHAGFLYTGVMSAVQPWLLRRVPSP